MCASEWGHAGVVRALLAAKAGVDAANQVSLGGSSEWGHAGVVRALLAAKAGACGCSQPGGPRGGRQCEVMQPTL